MASSQDFPLLAYGGLPNGEVCFTKPIGLPGYAECLVDQPEDCKHCIPFGHTFFCNHPDRHNFNKNGSTEAGGDDNPGIVNTR